MMKGEPNMTNTLGTFSLPVPVEEGRKASLDPAELGRGRHGLALEESRSRQDLDQGREVDPYVGSVNSRRETRFCNAHRNGT